MKKIEIDVVAKDLNSTTLFVSGWMVTHYGIQTSLDIHEKELESRTFKESSAQWLHYNTNIKKSIQFKNALFQQYLGKKLWEDIMCNVYDGWNYRGYLKRCVLTWGDNMKKLAQIWNWSKSVLFVFRLLYLWYSTGPESRIQSSKL